MDTKTKTGSRSGVSLSRQKETETVRDIATEARTIRERRTSTDVSEEKFAKIKSNRFYKILTDQGLSAEEKRDLFAQAQVADPNLSEEANRAKLEEMALFKEFMQAQRISVNKQLVELANNETFASMQGVIKELNEALHEFEDAMVPLNDIINAVHELREAGKTSDVIREINNDKAWIAQNEAEATKISAEIEAKNRDIRHVRDQIIEEENRKKFFFFKDTDPVRLSNLEDQLTTVRAEQDSAVTKAKEIKDALERGPGSDHPEVAAQKEVLAKMLNLSSDELTAQQAALRDAALKYINYAETRTEKAFIDFEKMGVQIEGAGRNLDTTQQVYAILEDSTKIAEVKNQDIREQFKTAAADESSIERMAREQKLALMDRFVQAVVDTRIDTTRAIGSMTKEKMGVQVMLDNNRQNLIESRTIKSDGVAGISGQLLTTINTVGSAALWHAQEAAKESMRNMSDFNDRIMSQEAINVATRLEDVNSDLVQRLERIAVLKEVKDSTMSIVRDGTRELLNNLDKSAEMSEAFKRSQAEALGSTADVLGEHLTGEQENSKGQSGGATGGTGFSNLFGGPK